MIPDRIDPHLEQYLGVHFGPDKNVHFGPDKEVTEDTLEDARSAIRCTFFTYPDMPSGSIKISPVQFRILMKMNMPFSGKEGMLMGVLNGPMIDGSPDCAGGETTMGFMAVCEIVEKCVQMKEQGLSPVEICLKLLNQDLQINKASLTRAIADQLILSDLSKVDRNNLLSLFGENWLPATLEEYRKIITLDHRRRDYSLAKENSAAEAGQTRAKMITPEALITAITKVSPMCGDILLEDLEKWEDISFLKATKLFGHVEKTLALHAKTLEKIATNTKLKNICPDFDVAKHFSFYIRTFRGHSRTLLHNDDICQVIEALLADDKALASLEKKSGLNLDEGKILIIMLNILYHDVGKAKLVESYIIFFKNNKAWAVEKGILSSLDATESEIYARSQTRTFEVFENPDIPLWPNEYIQVINNHPMTGQKVLQEAKIEPIFQLGTYTHHLGVKDLVETYKALNPFQQLIIDLVRYGDRFVAMKNRKFNENPPRSEKLSLAEIMGDLLAYVCSDHHPPHLIWAHFEKLIRDEELKSENDNIYEISFGRNHLLLHGQVGSHEDYAGHLLDGLAIILEQEFFASEAEKSAFVKEFAQNFLAILQYREKYEDKRIFKARFIRPEGESLQVTFYWINGEEIQPDQLTEKSKDELVDSSLHKVVAKNNPNMVSPGRAIRLLDGRISHHLNTMHGHLVMAKNELGVNDISAEAITNLINAINKINITIGDAKVILDKKDRISFSEIDRIFKNIIQELRSNVNPWLEILAGESFGSQPDSIQKVLDMTGIMMSDSARVEMVISSREAYQKDFDQTPVVTANFKILTHDFRNVLILLQAWCTNENNPLDQSALGKIERGVQGLGQAVDYILTTQKEQSTIAFGEIVIGLNTLHSLATNLIEEIEQALNAISEQCDHDDPPVLSFLSHQIAEINHLRKNKGNYLSMLKPETIDSRYIINIVRNSFGLFAEAQDRQNFEFVIDPGCDEYDIRMICANPELLGKTLGVLLKNSTETSKGRKAGENVIIKLNIYRDQNGVVVIVLSDTAGGLPADIPSVRAGVSSSSEKGHGNTHCYLETLEAIGIQTFEAPVYDATGQVIGHSMYLGLPPNYKDPPPMGAYEDAFRNAQHQLSQQAEVITENGAINLPALEERTRDTSESPVAKGLVDQREKLEHILAPTTSVA